MRKINERLGVPDNIVEVAESIFDNIISDIENSIVKNNRVKLKFVIDDNIGDVSIKNVKISINIEELTRTEVNTTEDIVLIGASIRNTSILKNNKSVSLNKKPYISINLAFIDKEISILDIKNFLISDRKELIKNLAHELMHKYDYVKKSKRDPMLGSTYKAYNEIGSTGIKSISEFFHYLYFTHTIENVTRPTEIVAGIKLNEIERENFEEFLNNDNTYKMLKKINSFTVTRFKKDLLNEIDKIDKFFEYVGITDTFKNNEDKVDKLLETLYHGIVNKTINIFKDTITRPIEKMFGLSDETIDTLEKAFGKYKKYENNIDKFYLDIEKMFIFVSNKYIKKINKLYDMTKTNKDSIVNWDLHQKINNKVVEASDFKVMSFSDFVNEDLSQFKY